MRRPLIAMVALVALVAMSGALAPSSASDTSPQTETYPIALGDPAHIEAGRIRFAQNCNYCHGSEGSGGKHRKLQCRDFEPDYLFETISNGLESGSFFMPPWADAFSEEKRWEVVGYILSLGEMEKCD